MDKLKISLTVILLSVLSCLAGISSEPINVMSFNIRYGLANDGDNSWKFRKEMVMDVIESHKPDLVGLQEALRFQLDAICDQFPGYGRVGIGRDPGGEGEYAAILYRKERFDVQETGTFWLSETPDQPSTHWGNKHLRICTWARLLDRTSGEFVYFYNTHYDHQSQPARINSSILLARKISERTHMDPVMLTGDFNADESNPAINYLKGEKVSGKAGPIRLLDSYRVLHPDETGVGTFNEFKGISDRGKIDYVFIEPGITVLEATIIRDNKDGHYPSDHFPVKARVQVEIDP